MFTRIPHWIPLSNEPHTPRRINSLHEVCVVLFPSIWKRCSRPWMGVNRRPSRTKRTRAGSVSPAYRGRNSIQNATRHGLKELLIAAKCPPNGNQGSWRKRPWYPRTGMTS